jgi:hypothetical protein
MATRPTITRCSSAGERDLPEPGWAWFTLLAVGAACGYVLAVRHRAIVLGLPSGAGLTLWTQRAELAWKRQQCRRHRHLAFRRTWWRAGVLAAALLAGIAAACWPARPM